MNTLSKETTKSVLGSAEAYTNICNAWKKYVNEGNPVRVEHYILYSALRGRDWRKAVTLLRDRNKLDNGAFESCGLVMGIMMLQSTSHNGTLIAPFGSALTVDTLNSIRAMMPSASDVAYHADNRVALKSGTYPFDAYCNAPVVAVAAEATR